MTEPILEISNLVLEVIPSSQRILKGINLRLKKAKLTGIVGESGSGKTMTALSIMGLLPNKLKISSGEIIFHRDNQSSFSLLNQNDIRRVRGKEISMIFQEPMSSLNPSMTCGTQIEEVLRIHSSLERKIRKEKVLHLLEKVKLPDPEKASISYPHQLSGGQLQRIMISMALAVKPALLIADEPTTALDVTVQKEILLLLKDLQKEYALSILFITHDLRILKEIADDIIVMKEGEIIENGESNRIFNNPEKPYTKGLIACQPSLEKRPEKLLTVNDFEQGNLSHPKEKARIDYSTSEIILQIKNLNLSYLSADIYGRKKFFTALKNIDLKVFQGETLGLVGESGCGKTSLGKTILGLVKAQSGDIWYKNNNLPELTDKEFRKFRKNIQVVFQDPYSSLNPRIKIKTMLFEARKLHFSKEKYSESLIQIQQLILNTGLNIDSLEKYPHEFSGGQRQRLGIARALATEPEFLVLDEAVSALDVSIQAQILNLLNDLKEKYKLSYIFISHDLSVVKHMSDRIIIMQNGEITEEGDPDKIYKHPKSDYTRTLINSIPGS